MIYCDAPVADAMHQTVLQQRLAETEEQIASGLPPTLLGNAR
jgi:hypothetical protein